MLYIIGLGLNPPKSITQEGLEAIQSCEEVYFENYTSVLPCTIEELETHIQKKIILAPREQMEQKAGELKNKNAAILIMGDPLAATTHIDIAKDAKTIHNASIFTAIAQTGISIYKCGQTTSIPFPQDFKINTPMQVINNNKPLHTLCLLDIDPKTETTMTTKQAIQQLKTMENCSLKPDSKLVLCASMGTEEQKIIYGELKDLENREIKTYPQCLIVLGDLHFKEEEILNTYGLFVSTD